MHGMIIVTTSGSPIPSSPSQDVNAETQFEVTNLYKAIKGVFSSTPRHSCSLPTKRLTTPL